MHCFKCQNFFLRSDQCFIKPCCVGCGQNPLSDSCLTKSIPNNDLKLDPLYCNCNERNTANFKVCKNSPIKPNFKKSYADIIKNSKASNPQSQTTYNDRTPMKTSNSNTNPKMAPPDPVSIYYDFEIGNEVSRLFQIVEKNLYELKIDYFISLADYLEKLLKQKIAQKDIARKVLTFFDGISSLTKQTTKENYVSN